MSAGELPAVVVPVVDLERVQGPYLRALLRVMLEGAERREPLGGEHFALALPPELEAWCAAFARHHPPSLRLGEFWASTPKQRKDRRAVRGAEGAVELGILASGDAVVARVQRQRVRVVELSHEENAERARGDLEGFLRRCVAYAREREAETCLDAYLPEGDRDG